MESPISRRAWLARLGAGLAGLIAATLGAPALLFLADPLRRRGTVGRPPVPVARLSQVPDVDQGGRPLRAVISGGEQRDAWTRFPTSKLGSVWLYRRGGDLVCLSAICPHAGCTIDHDERTGGFVCPCHNSTFSLDGSRRHGPAPRDMDRLEIEVKGGEVLCRFHRYRLGTADKEPIG